MKRLNHNDFINHLAQKAHEEQFNLRDYFAGLVMQGYINNSSEIKLSEGQTYDQALSVISYLIADSMMEARK